MLATTPEEFLRAFGDGRAFRSDRPVAMRAALVVTPVGFRVSEESATDNRYMRPGSPVDVPRALAQHRNLVSRLGELGVPAVVVSGREGLDDAVYPNNVYGTAPGRFVVGSMLHPVRRAEAQREDVRALFRDTFSYAITDLSTQSCVAELTGPLVLDRPRGIGYCGMTGRVDEAGCAAMHEAFDLRLTFRFGLVPEEYHTNLVLAVLAGRACVLYPGAFTDPGVPDAIARVYDGRTLVLTDEEKQHFAGNCLAVNENDVLFSATARQALRPSSVEALESWGFRLHDVEVDELEKGGGSLRCLIAEVF